MELQEDNITSLTKSFEGNPINMTTEGDKLCIDLKQTALMLETTEQNISNHLKRHAEEFVEGADYSTDTICVPGKRTRYRRLLHPDGFLLMSMFVRSKKAAAVRKWMKGIVSEFQRNGIYNRMTNLENMILLQQSTIDSLTNTQLEMSRDIKSEITNNSKISLIERNSIKLKVDAIVRNICSRDGLSRAKIYPQVWGNLNRKFGVNTYTELERGIFPQVLDELNVILDVTHESLEQKKKRGYSRSY